MSVAEMKLAAINQITNMEDENTVKEILEHLAKLKNSAKEKFDEMVVWLKTNTSKL